jgi:hypothetical protein
MTDDLSRRRKQRQPSRETWVFWLLAVAFGIVGIAGMELLRAWATRGQL